MESESKNLPDIVQIRELVDKLEPEQLNELSSFIVRKLNIDFKHKVGILPNLANAEYAIFDERKNLNKITPKVLEIRKRRYMVFVYLYANVDRTHDQIIEYIRLLNPDLSYVQAARDLTAVKNVMGNTLRSQKELLRHQVIEMLKKAYQRAEAIDATTDMVSAANGIGRAANIDKEDMELPYDEFIPPSFEPVNDLEALGEGFENRTSLEKDIDRIKKKYGFNVEDAEIV